MEDKEIGEMWRDHKEASKVKRASNRTLAPEALAKEGITFESKNDGAHLIVKQDNEKPVDFWPGTGKFICRETGKDGRGVRNVIKHINRKRVRQ